MLTQAAKMELERRVLRFLGRKEFDDHFIIAYADRVEPLGEVRTVYASAYFAFVLPYTGEEPVLS